MRINNNLMAMNTHRQMGVNGNNSAKSMEKLSSGLRINRAGDDAAGLAISEKMRGQIRGLNMASRNSQDSISLVQTAEGALNETQAILQRMRELSVQSANDTNVNVDREALQNEVDELAKEISRISNNTEFNTQKLLDGKFDGTFHIGANEGQSLDLSIADMRANALGVAGDAKFELTGAIADGGDTNTDIADGTYTVDGNDLKDANGAIVATTADSGLTYTSAVGDDTITFEQAVTSGSVTVNGAAATGTGDIAGHSLESGDYSVDVTAGTLSDAAGNVIATSADNQNYLSVKDGTTNILTLDAVSTADLEISVGGTDISTQANANTAITTINDALESVSNERAKLGAVQNRLEHTIKNLDTTSENLQASESRIRDIDMAKEMMSLTKNNILQQAAQAMLAQANQAPQGVLQLLR